MSGHPHHFLFGFGLKVQFTYDFTYTQADNGHQPLVATGSLPNNAQRRYADEPIGEYSATGRGSPIIP